jgi:hypothetical protein
MMVKTQGIHGLKTKKMQGLIIILNLNYELKTDSLGSKLNLNAAYLNYKRFQYTDNKTYTPMPTEDVGTNTPTIAGSATDH